MQRREFFQVIGGGIIGASTWPGCGRNPKGRRSERAASFGSGEGMAEVVRPVRFGLLTDLHYADRDTVGSRHYRDSLSKAAECIRRCNEQQVDFVIEMGDMKDTNSPPEEAATLRYLRAVEGVFQQFRGPTYHVLGNHDMDSISKEQFLANVDNTGIEPGHGYYSFAVNGVHFIVLDANYTGEGKDYNHGNFDWTDANVPARQLEWLAGELAVVDAPTIVFIHQLLDGAGSYYVKNAAEVRAILEDSGKVAAVFQGHHHAGGYRRLQGIHYYTLKAMVEGPYPANNAYALVDVLPDKIVINGYANVEDRQLATVPLPDQPVSSS